MIDTPQTQSALIGCILSDANNAIPACIEAGIDMTWWTDSRNRAIWQTAFDLYKSGRCVDLVTVHDTVNRLNADVTSRYMEDCIDQAVTAFTKRYIADLTAHHLWLTAQRTVGSIAGDIEEATITDLADKIAKAQQRMNALTLGYNSSESILDAGNRLIDSWQNPANSTLIDWPISVLNDTVGRLSDELVFLAALESIGKTAMALQIAVHTAMTGKRVSIASLESKTAKLVQRMIASVGRLNTIALRQRNATHDKYDLAREVVRKLHDLPISIDDRGKTIDQLHAWARAEQARGSALLIVDNMRHIRPAKKYASTVDQFRDFSVQLKWIRDDTSLPFIVLHHLTDDGDVSWSKDIRRDADLLIYLTHNESRSIMPCRDNNWLERAYVDLEVRKHREGMRHIKHTLEFHKDHQYFEEAK